MPKVIIEIMDDEDGVILSLSGYDINERSISLAQSIGMLTAAIVKAQIWDETMEFVASKLPRSNKEG